VFKNFLILFPSLLFSLHAFANSAAPVPNKAVTPSARTCPGLNGAYVTGEFLYWKARQEEQIYAATIDITTSATDQIQNFKPLELDFTYDPAFKLGVGGDLPFDGWDLYLNWTHFHASPSSSTSSNRADLVSLFTRILEATTPFVGRSAKASWNLMFNSLDFDWGRRFYLSQTLTVRPSFGGKAAWINQEFRYSLQEVELAATGTPISNESVKWINNFWGVGPYLAVDGKWEFIWGLGVYGEISGALFWGQFTRDRRVDRNVQDEQTQVVSLLRNQIAFKAHRVRPTVQAFLGLDWEWCFIENWLSVNLRIGYETQYFWAQVINSPEGSTSGDLTFEGLTFMGRIDF